MTKLLLLLYIHLCSLALTASGQSIPDMVFRDYSDPPDVFQPSTDDIATCKPEIETQPQSCNFQDSYPVAYHKYLWKEQDPLRAWNPQPEYGWVKLSSAAEGFKESKSIAALAISRRPLDCAAPAQNCEGVVKYRSTKEEGPSGFALCLMSKTAENVLMPRSCDPILITTTSEPLIKVLTGYRFVGYAPIDNSMFNVLIQQRPLGNIKGISAILTAAMTSSPLSLRLSKSVVGPHGAIFQASAGPRRSDRLKDFNEWVTVDAEILMLGDSQSDQYIGISTSVNVLVNRQKTDNSTDWHMIPFTDQNNYEQWVAGLFLSKMASYCSPHSVDFHTIVCERSAVKR